MNRVQEVFQNKAFIPFVTAGDPNLDVTERLIVAMAEAGADLDLCGHTHDGQMFPGNLVTALMWENSCGYLQKGAMHNIVTSGIGVFGPNMRVGTKSEICSITVHFTGK